MYSIKIEMWLRREEKSSSLLAEVQKTAVDGNSVVLSQRNKLMDFKQYASANPLRKASGHFIL